MRSAGHELYIRARNKCNIPEDLSKAKFYVMFDDCRDSI